MTRANAIVTGIVTIGVLLLVAGVFLLWPPSKGTVSQPPAGVEVTPIDAKPEQAELSLGAKPKSGSGGEHDAISGMAIRSTSSPSPLADEAAESVQGDVELRPKEALLKERLLALLRSPRDRVALTQDDKDALKELSAEGVDVVGLSMAEYQAPDPEEVTLVARNLRILDALAVMNTEQAQTSLLKIALSGDAEHPALPVYAAEAYARSGVASAEKGRLLESPNLSVQWVATKAVRGDELSKESVTGIVGLLQRTPSVQARCDSAVALAADPGRMFSTAKVTAIAEAVAQEGKRDGAANPTYGTIWTERELTLICYTDALTQMAGATQAIKEQLTDSRGDVKSVLTAALAGRGEAAVRSDLLRGISDSRDGVIRTILAGSLQAVATSDDIPYLKTLAESDSFKKKDENGQDTFPVREAAQRVLAKLQ